MLDIGCEYVKLILLGGTQQQRIGMATDKQDPIGASDDFISLSEIEVMPRGRKTVLNGDLLDTLSSLTAGNAVRLSKAFGEVPKAKRPAVSASIRKHWQALNIAGDISVAYTLTGVPQAYIK
jgi:hypothetical protein